VALEFIRLGKGRQYFQPFLVTTSIFLESGYLAYPNDRLKIAGSPVSDDLQHFTNATLLSPSLPQSFKPHQFLTRLTGLPSF
jgi:hypothetical protein